MLQVVEQCVSKKKKIGLSRLEFDRLHSAQEQVDARSSSKPQAGGVMRTQLVDRGDQEINNLEAEVGVLDACSKQLFLEVFELRQSKIAALYARTWKGHLNNMLGYGCSVYCVYKMVKSMQSVFFNASPDLGASDGQTFIQSSTADPITKTISFVFMLFNVHINSALWSQYISFVFIGMLIAMSVRGFLSNVMKFFFAISGQGKSNSSNLVLFVSEIMGMYFLSSILLLRASLDEEHRQVMTDVLGRGFQFNFYHRWFDAIFLASAIFSLVVLCAQYNLRRTDKNSVD